MFLTLKKKRQLMTMLLGNIFYYPTLFFNDLLVFTCMNYSLMTFKMSSNINRSLRPFLNIFKAFHFPKGII